MPFDAIYRPYRSPLIGKVARILDDLRHHDAGFSEIAKALRPLPQQHLRAVSALLGVGFMQILPDSTDARPHRPLPARNGQGVGNL